MNGESDTPQRIDISSFSWPEVTAGADLAALVTAHVELVDGDVVVITSKVVSKAEGRVQPGGRPQAVARELTRVVARRGPNVIAQTRHGLVMAAAGVDASNVDSGSVVTLPRDPDESARRLREALFERTGCNVAVVVTDTAGRAWRNGQTDMAIGCAGIPPLVDLAGTVDRYGNVLSVTAPADADEIAAAADLVKGKTTGRPVAVVRGLRSRVLPPGVPGPGAATLVRGSDDDLFGLGSRDAVVAASLRVDPVALSSFPQRIESDPDPFDRLTSQCEHVRIASNPQHDAPGVSGAATWLVQIEVCHPTDPEDWVEVGALSERVRTLAAANRLTAQEPAPAADTSGPGWRIVSRTAWSVA
jgi:coenzyme F420-0:L-glutamate ligase / coenzyme F420-1:gamma-L-glutamate ligase